MTFGVHFWALLPTLAMYGAIIAVILWAIIAIFRLGTAYKRLADARENAWRAGLGGLSEQPPNPN